MLTKETAERIWIVYREIEAGQKMLDDIATERARPFADRDELAPRLTDHFGHKRSFELGVPSGDNGHRIFAVAPALAECVIRAHIAKMKEQLRITNEQARMECATDDLSNGDGPVV